MKWTAVAESVATPVIQAESVNQRQTSAVVPHSEPWTVEVLYGARGLLASESQSLLLADE